MQRPPEQILSQIIVYIGELVPPLERLERREEPKAQGGEFVEAYVAKRTRQISPTRALALDASATSAGTDFKLNPVYIVCPMLLGRILQAHEASKPEEKPLQEGLCRRQSPDSVGVQVRFSVLCWCNVCRSRIRVYPTLVVKTLLFQPKRRVVFCGICDILPSYADIRLLQEKKCRGKRNARGGCS